MLAGGVAAYREAGDLVRNRRGRPYVHVVDDNPGTLHGEPAGDGAPDPGSGTGDDDAGTVDCSGPVVDPGHAQTPPVRVRPPSSTTL